MTETKRIKIGIISDTHGLLRPEVVEILKNCDYIFHAGDVDRPELLDALRPLGALYVVRGNNDGYWAQNLRRSLNFTVGNVKFFNGAPKLAIHFKDILLKENLINTENKGGKIMFIDTGNKPQEKQNRFYKFLEKNII